MLPLQTFTQAPSIIALASTLVGESNVNVRTGIIYGADPTHRLDIYAPRASVAKAPVALFIYGGNWRNGHRANFGFVGAALAARGIATAIPDYRRFPDVRWPAFQEDATLAFQFVRRELAADSDRPLVVIGHSAGAHIAALLAFDRRWLGSNGPDAFVGLSGPYAFQPTRWPSTRDIFATAASANEARPVAHVTRHAPPTLVLHGEIDDVVKPHNSDELAAAMLRCGATVETMMLPAAGHRATVLGFARPFRRRYPVLDPIVDFVSALRGSDIKSAGSATSASRRAG